MTTTESNVRTERPLYREIACRVQARLNCIAANNMECLDKHTAWIEAVIKDTAPSGSGIDCGTKIDMDASKPNRLVFTLEYHHMNDVGMYDGWTEHKIIVTPSLTSGYDMRITGRDRNQIKDYLHDVYSSWLAHEIEIS
jgi:hypothetical protein